LYTISDLVKKQKANNKVTENYRFGQEQDKNEAKSIYGAGSDTLDEELDPYQEEDYQSPHSYRDTSDVDYRGLNSEILMDIMRQKDSEIERLHSVIQSLNSNLEKALELNSNNQVLLLNKQLVSDEKRQVGEAGFWGRLFRKGR
jgi:hypothetical protein